MVFSIFLRIILLVKMRSALVETITWLDAEQKNCTQLTGRYLYFSSWCSYSVKYPFFSFSFHISIFVSEYHSPW